MCVCVVCVCCHNSRHMVLRHSAFFHRDVLGVHWSSRGAWGPAANLGLPGCYLAPVVAPFSMSRVVALVGG